MSTAANEYAFLTRWMMPGTSCEEISSVIGDARGLVRWWPAVYLDVKVLDPGDARGLGRKIELFTRGWLPYSLRWRFETVSSNAPNGYSIQAAGDLVGRGVWTFTQRGAEVEVVYDWRIRADKPVLRYLSFLMKPIFTANHHWAMARGEESLRLELQRRHAISDEERARVPPPRGPMPPALSGGMMLGGFAVLGGLVYLMVRALG
jgi:hypothetical protein